MVCVFFIQCGTDDIAHLRLVQRVKEISNYIETPSKFHVLSLKPIHAIASSGLVAEVACVCGAVEDLVESDVCFRDGLSDSLVGEYL